MHEEIAHRLVELNPKIAVAGMADATEESACARLVHACAEGECALLEAAEPLGEFAAAPKHPAGVCIPADALYTARW